MNDNSAVGYLCKGNKLMLWLCCKRDYTLVPQYKNVVRTTSKVNGEGQNIQLDLPFLIQKNNRKIRTHTRRPHTHTSEHLTVIKTRTQHYTNMHEYLYHTQTVLYLCILHCGL